MDKAYIYRIEIDKCFYYGSTCNIKKRLSEHLSALIRGTHVNKHMQAAYNKYNDFEMYPVFVCSKEEQFDIEQSYINTFIKKPKCMNINPDAANAPGMRGKKHTEETKKILSERKLGNTNRRSDTVHTFHHADGIAIECTAYDLYSTQPNVTQRGIGKLVRGELKKHKGWRIIND